jgi:hypothetical protein
MTVLALLADAYRKAGHLVISEPATRTRLVTVPTELAAMAAGVTPATVRKWASRGKLTRYGQPGKAEYDLNELYELVGSARRQRRNPGRET